MIDKKSFQLNMIAAMARGSRTIGMEDGSFPWEKILEDLRRFKKITIEHPIIMGRKTWETFSSRPLPGRPHIVITRDPNYETDYGDQVTVVTSIATAIALAKKLDSKMAFIIGGGQIYTATIDQVDRLYLTIVDIETDGLVKFPRYEHRPREVVDSRNSSDHNYHYQFITIDFLDLEI